MSARREPVAATGIDPRTVRHQANRERLLAEAWAIARRDGLAAVSLGELARRVGLRQPSLYTYFDSKLDLYDAMFAQGNDELWEDIQARTYPGDPRRAVKEISQAIVRFCAADPARYQLMFQRPIPGFEPSEQAFARAVRFYEWVQSHLERAGIRSQDERDMYTALVAGIADQQVANDPGGDRWLKHMDAVIDMFFEWLERR